MNEANFEIIWRILNTGGVLVLVLSFIIFRKKHRAETEGMLAANHLKNLDIQMKYNEELINQMEKYQKQAEALSKTEKANSWVIAQLKRDAEECAYKHIIAEMEIDQLKRHNQFKPLVKFDVFVLDDDVDVLADFRQKFSKSSVLNFHGFATSREFMRRVKIEKPSVVVVDYRLDGGSTTAEDIILSLGYEPDIFVMSNLGRYEYKLPKQKKVRFFVKDDGMYVYRIVKDIVNLLADRVI